MTQVAVKPEIKTRNENKKKKCNKIILRGGDACKMMIITIIGSALADMSTYSHQKVMSWKRTTRTDLTDPLAGLHRRRDIFN